MNKPRSAILCTAIDTYDVRVLFNSSGDGVVPGPTTTNHNTKSQPIVTSLSSRTTPLPSSSSITIYALSSRIARTPKKLEAHGHIYRTFDNCVAFWTKYNFLAQITVATIGSIDKLADLMISYACVYQRMKQNTTA